MLSIKKSSWLMPFAILSCNLIINNSFAANHSQDLQENEILIDSSCKNADSIFFTNGKILTLNDTLSTATNLYVKGDKIAGVNIQDPNAECTIDLNGRTVMPGIIDNHAHFVETLYSAGFDLFQAESAQSIDDILIAIKDKVTKIPKGSLITALGSYPTGITGTPSLKQLDKVAPHNPIIISRSFQGKGHLNSAAIRLLEKWKPNLSINQDGTTASGFDTTQAIETLSRIDTKESKARAAMDYMSWANSLGVTTVVEAGLVNPEVLELWKDNKLTVKLRYGV